MQSIWQSELGKKFKRVEADLEKNWRDFSPEMLQNKVQNLEKGWKMLENLAISGNFSPIFRKKYPWEGKKGEQIGGNEKTDMQKNAENVVFLSILGQKIGIFEGKSHFFDGIPVFNYNEFLETFVDVENPKQTFTELFPVISILEAMPVGTML